MNSVAEPRPLPELRKLPEGDRVMSGYAGFENRVFSGNTYV